MSFLSALVLSYFHFCSFFPYLVQVEFSLSEVLWRQFSCSVFCHGVLVDGFFVLKFVIAF